MKVTFYSNDCIKSISINYDLDKVWLGRENDKSHVVDDDKISNVIYEALDKYLKENY